MVSRIIFFVCDSSKLICGDTLWVVGNDHRLADDESLAKMLEAVESRTNIK